MPNEHYCSCLSEKRRRIYRLFRNCLQLDRNADYQLRAYAFWTVLDELEYATPRLLLSIFPPKKIYDGEKYQTKDYFSTMKMVEEFGIDRQFGEKAFDFLWDYMNRTTMEFVVFGISVLNDLQHAQGKPGISEAISEGLGIPMYSKFTGMDGREVMRNNVTGECQVINEPKPRIPHWWSVIEGGSR